MYRAAQNYKHNLIKGYVMNQYRSISSEYIFQILIFKLQATRNIFSVR